MKKRNNDFPESVKKLLAGSAGYRCSVPYCNRTTIGSEKNNREKLSSSGMACHIYAASENGPRFKNDETKEFIRSIDNGIWCCYNHGKIIDNNEGISYSAETLFSWKKNHEYRISCENGGQKNTSLGWFYKINIGFNPIFKRDSNFELTKSTLLFGDSGVGKTLIAQWLQTLCIGDIAHNRLTCEKMILSDFSLKYFTDSENEAQIQIENNKITRHVNGTIIVDPFFDIRVIYIPFIHPSYDESINNLDYVSKRINIPKRIIKQLESEINRTEFKLSKGDISFKNENIILSSYYNRELSSLTFNNLSPGERDAICIEIVCAYARQSAMRVPTLLILDIDGASLHTKMKKQFAQLLSKQTFQTLILSNSNWGISEQELIKEWCSYEIRKHDTGSEIIPIN